MALKNAILAALLDGEASGYDLAKEFDASVANFWMATPQQLYRELDRLEAAGLVSATLIEQQGRPNKRVFRLTDRGHETLAAFTRRHPKPTAIRDELMVQMQAVDHGDAAAVRAVVQERLEGSRGKLQRYQRLQARLLDGRTEDEYVAEAPRIGPYLTLRRGIAFEEENARWYRLAIRVLDRRTSGAR
jgi:DNA-binding PadR family transcriptional regulator